MTNQKVVVLAIDAASSDLLLRWSHDGTLPTFQALLSKGLTGFTSAPPGLFVGSTWASLYTGVNPGKHGRYSQRQIKPGTYELYPYGEGLGVKREPFWNYLSQAGRRVAILDVPHSSLSPDLNGIQVVEYGAHDADCGFQAWPQSLAKEIKARFGQPTSHPIRGDCDAKRDPDSVAAFRDTLLKGIANKTELTKHFLHQENWDLFAQVFTETHCIGHQCWHIHDPTQQWHDAEAAKIIGDPIKDVYQAIDKALGEILPEIDNKATVIILVSHGMGPTNVQYGFMEKLLLHLKVAVPPRASPQNAISFFVYQKLLPFLSSIWQKTPSNMQKFLGSMKATFAQELYSVPVPSQTDKEASKCFSIHDNPSHAGIRINVVGREPHGKIRQGSEYQKFCDNLEKDLLGIINVGTGKPVVNRVIRTAEYYSGDYLEHFADLLVEWNEEDPILSVYSEKFGEIPTSFLHPRTGHHRPGGMFLAFGPLVQPGTLNRTLSVMDFAPTIAQMLNVSLPDIDGQPISELLGSSVSTVPSPDQ